MVDILQTIFFKYIFSDEQYFILTEVFILKCPIDKGCHVV